MRAGAPWADIPERYGPYTTCYKRFVRWRKLGIWDRIFEAPALRLEQCLAWLVGFGLYQWLSPSGPHWWRTLIDHTHPGYVSFTASLPSFAAAFALSALAALLTRRPRAAFART